MLTIGSYSWDFSDSLLSLPLFLVSYLLTQCVNKYCLERVRIEELKGVVLELSKDLVEKVISSSDIADADHSILLQLNPFEFTPENLLRFQPHLQEQLQCFYQQLVGNLYVRKTNHLLEEITSLIDHFSRESLDPTLPNERRYANFLRLVVFLHFIAEELSFGYFMSSMINFINHERLFLLKPLMNSFRIDMNDIKEINELDEITFQVIQDYLTLIRGNSLLPYWETTTENM